MAGHQQVTTHAASPAISVPVSLVACHAAWLKARRGKRPSANQLAFEVRWLDRLLELKTALRAGVWQPARTVSFIVNQPKTREIHAPDFADRVVHHLLVERLEKIYEPVFIHDSYANRKTKGSHAAVDRLQQFMRSRNGQGWYLQLDIHNYFNSINRHTLYRMLCHRLHQCERRDELPAAHALAHLQAQLGSYWGHFAHANSVRLRHALFERFVWLKSLFILHPDGHLTPRWVLQGATFVAQAAALQAEWPQAQCLIQKGNRWVQLSQPGQELNAPASQRLTASLRRQGIAYVCANQTGWLRHGTRRREVRTWFVPHARGEVN
jgi:hypothetical protein